MDKIRKVRKNLGLDVVCVGCERFRPKGYQGQDSCVHPVYEQLWWAHFVRTSDSECSHFAPKEDK
jgi:hypothetical protein